MERATMPMFTLRMLTGCPVYRLALSYWSLRQSGAAAAELGVPAAAHTPKVHPVPQPTGGGAGVAPTAANGDPGGGCPMS